MSDVIIFVVGCLMSVIVASAVALLFWAAANEPRGTLLPSDESPSPEPRPDPASAKSSSPVVSESRV